MWSEEPGIAKVLFNTQKNSVKYQFIQGMWSEEPTIAKVLFNTQKNSLKYLIQGMWSKKLGMNKILFDIQEIDLEYQFTQGMWSEELSMSKVLFDIQTNSKTHDTQYNNPKCVKKAFINNNTFSGCLHSRGVVKPFPLDLQDKMHIFQPLM